MISIVIPTNKPVEYVLAVIESLSSTTVPVEVLVVTDADSEVYDQAILALVGMEFSIRGGRPPDRAGIFSHSGSGDHAERGHVRVRLCESSSPGAIAAWNEGLRVSTGEHLLIGADDLRFHAGGLEAALEAHARVLGGYGVIGLNDLHHDGSTHTTHFLFDRRFCQEKLGGVMAYPVYSFLCNDNEILGRAILHNAYYWCKEAVVEHLHPSNSKRPLVGDEQERANCFSGDVETFYRRKAAGFPDDFERVI